MKALLIKDFYNIKEQLKFYVIMLVLYGIFAATSGNTGSFSGMLIMMITIMLINTISYDERAKWDRFCLSTPISRKQIVGEKYVLGMILFVITAVISVVFLVLTEDSMDVKEAIIYTAAIEGFVTFLLSLILPAIFKFGIEKGRIVMMAVLLIPLFIAFVTPFASEYLNAFDFTLFNKLSENLTMTVVFVGVAIIYAISYLLSLKFYSQKEF